MTDMTLNTVFYLGSHLGFAFWPAHHETAFLIEQERCSEQSHYSKVNCICQNVSD